MDRRCDVVKALSGGTQAFGDGTNDGTDLLPACTVMTYRAVVQLLVLIIGTVRLCKVRGKPTRNYDKPCQSTAGEVVDALKTCVSLFLAAVPLVLVLSQASPAEIGDSLQESFDGAPQMLGMALDSMIRSVTWFYSYWVASVAQSKERVTESAAMRAWWLLAALVNLAEVADAVSWIVSRKDGTWLYHGQPGATVACGVAYLLLAGAALCSNRHYYDASKATGVPAGRGVGIHRARQLERSRASKARRAAARGHRSGGDGDGGEDGYDSDEEIALSNPTGAGAEARRRKLEASGQIGQLGPKWMESLRGAQLWKDAQYSDGMAYRTLRYTAVHVHNPEDFSAAGYSLRCRPHTNTPDSRIKLLICINLSNEPPEAFAKTMRGVCENLKELVRQEGHPVFAQVACCVMVDGYADEKGNLTECHPDTLQLAQSYGIFDPRMIERRQQEEETRFEGERREEMRRGGAPYDPANPPPGPPPPPLHLFEFSAQLSEDENFVKYFPPLQVIFAVKHQRTGKLDTHRWFFEAFAAQLEPLYCFTTYAGTKLAERSVYKLYMAMETHDHYGAVCAELMATAGVNRQDWVASAQGFNLKLSHIFDRALESIFGYVLKMPECATLYRWEAIKPDHDTGDGPLREYFRAAEHVVTADASQDLELVHRHAPQRVLQFQILARPGRRWLTGYVKNAYAIVGVPTDIDELITEQARWLNAAHLGVMYNLHHFSELWEHSAHSLSRKTSLLALQIYSMIAGIIAWFSPSLFFTVYFAAIKELKQPCKSYDGDIKHNCWGGKTRAEGIAFGFFNETGNLLEPGAGYIAKTFPTNAYGADSFGCSCDPNFHDCTPPESGGNDHWGCAMMPQCVGAYTGDKPYECCTGSCRTAFQYAVDPGSGEGYFRYKLNSSLIDPQYDMYKPLAKGKDWSQRVAVLRYLDQGNFTGPDGAAVGNARASVYCNHVSGGIGDGDNAQHADASKWYIGSTDAQAPQCKKEYCLHGNALLGIPCTCDMTNGTQTFTATKTTGQKDLKSTPILCDPVWGRAGHINAERAMAPPEPGYTPWFSNATVLSTLFAFGNISNTKDDELVSGGYTSLPCYQSQSANTTAEPDTYKTTFNYRNRYLQQSCCVPAIYEFDFNATSMMNATTWMKKRYDSKHQTVQPLWKEKETWQNEPSSESYYEGSARPWSMNLKEMYTDCGKGMTLNHSVANASLASAGSTTSPVSYECDVTGCGSGIDPAQYMQIAFMSILSLLVLSTFIFAVGNEPSDIAYESKLVCTFLGIGVYMILFSYISYISSHATTSPVFGITADGMLWGSITVFGAPFLAALVHGEFGSFCRGVPAFIYLLPTQLLTCEVFALNILDRFKTGTVQIFSVAGHSGAPATKGVMNSFEQRNRVYRSKWILSWLIVNCAMSVAIMQMPGGRSSTFTLLFAVAAAMVGIKFAGSVAFAVRHYLQHNPLCGRLSKAHRKRLEKHRGAEAVAAAERKIHEETAARRRRKVENDRAENYLADVLQDEMASNDALANAVEFARRALREVEANMEVHDRSLEPEANEAEEPGSEAAFARAVGNAIKGIDELQNLAVERRKLMNLRSRLPNIVDACHFEENPKLRTAHQSAKDQISIATTFRWERLGQIRDVRVRMVKATGFVEQLRQIERLRREGVIQRAQEKFDSLADTYGLGEHPGGGEALMRARRSLHRGRRDIEVGAADWEKRVEGKLHRDVAELCELHAEVVEQQRSIQRHHWIGITALLQQLSGPAADERCLTDKDMAKDVADAQDWMIKLQQGESPRLPEARAACRATRVPPSPPARPSAPPAVPCAPLPLTADPPPTPLPPPNPPLPPRPRSHRGPSARSTRRRYRGDSAERARGDRACVRAHERWQPPQAHVWRQRRWRAAACG